MLHSWLVGFWAGKNWEVQCAGPCAWTGDLEVHQMRSLPGSWGLCRVRWVEASPGLLSEHIGGSSRWKSAGRLPGFFEGIALQARRMRKGLWEGDTCVKLCVLMWEGAGLQGGCGWNTKDRGSGVALRGGAGEETGGRLLSGTGLGGATQAPGRRLLRSSRCRVGEAQPRMAVGMGSGLG